MPPHRPVPRNNSALFGTTGAAANTAKCVPCGMWPRPLRVAQRDGRPDWNSWAPLQIWVLPDFSQSHLCSLASLPGRPLGTCVGWWLAPHDLSGSSRSSRTPLLRRRVVVLCSRQALGEPGRGGMPGGSRVPRLSASIPRYRLYGLD